MGGLREEELLVGVELRLRELAVALGGDLLVGRAMLQAMRKHVLEVLEELGVGVMRREAGGDVGALEEAQHERETFPPAGRYRES